MKLYSWVVCVGAACLWGACEKDLDKYTGKDYIRFSNDCSEDSIQYNFGLAGKIEADRIPLEMIVSGSTPDYDRSYSVVINEATTAKEGEHFKLLSGNLVIRKGRVSDTLWLDVMNCEELKGRNLYLQLDLQENNNFSLCFPDHNICKIYLSDIIEKPEWWDEWQDTEGLGQYTEKKFRLFVQVSGIADLGKEEYPEKREAILKFKYYLEKEANQGNVILDEDNKPMTVAMYG